MNKFLLLLALFSSIGTIYAHKRTTMQGCPPQAMEKKYGDKGKTNVETKKNAIGGAVRCCGEDWKVSGRAPWICVSPKSCNEYVTYEKAEEICKGLGKELCTKQQMTIGGCCGTGCKFDSKATWIRN